MAIEPKRGCGFRQVGGLYLVGGEIMTPCDRLPIELKVCPVCGAGVKYTRAWTWIQPTALFGGDHRETLSPMEKCSCDLRGDFCPACHCRYVFGDDGRAGLLWIGKQFYKTPADFIQEGKDLGISRRIAALPRGFQVGKTYIFFAHIEAAETIVGIEEGPHKGQVIKKMGPGIFSGFMPRRIERIVKQSELTAYNLIETEIEKYGMDALKNFMEENPETKRTFMEMHKNLKADTRRGITLVPVPDDDRDHNKKGL